ncbi:M42 family peptidase [Clostridium sp. MSJ-11]|uniref:M42 family peptidase n=1 Tax=Clostridium mobile TaxID=2841512 RepID=A0ABS6EMU4_9CLOT|nr:M42 family peptidase [Clostridium mobile]MBU5486548.1 M42 family peptidase [Clostridium mobile]
MDKLLVDLINAFGVSGNEDGVKNIIKEELKETNFKILEDSLGNLIVNMGTGKKKIMVCSHMDSIGFIASFIEDNGLIKVEKIGNFQSKDIVHSIVKFKNGTIGKMVINKDELFIDIGITEKEEVLKFVEEGDTACLVGPCISKEHSIIGANLDNRVGCYVLLKLLKELSHSENEIYFVFSTQQQLGGRGARAAAYKINPEYCIVLDLEDVKDIIDGDGIKLGNGPLIKVMDKSLIMHEEIKEILDESAKALGINLQYGVSNSTSDGGLIHKEGQGIKTGEMSIPCKYKNSFSAMVNSEDIDQCIKILKEIL